MLIGVWGVNAHAAGGTPVFATNDFDLFRLFLAAHADALRQMLHDDEDEHRKD